MKIPAKKTDTFSDQYILEVFRGNESGDATKALRENETELSIDQSNALNPFFGQNQLPALKELLSRFIPSTGKSSFLVFKHHKYFTIPVENIAFFYVKYESSFIVCFDGQEYSINYSLEHLQKLLAMQQFFRLNRQYLINFKAVKEVEHYFARKLLVKLTIATRENLLIAKEKVTGFLNWMENR